MTLPVPLPANGASEDTWDADLGASLLAVHTAAQSAASTASTAAAGKLAKASNLADLVDAAAARTALGLGNSATLAVGTTGGTVAAGDDGRFGVADGAVTLAKFGLDALAVLAATTRWRGTWAAATAYEANELVTRGEGLYLVANDHTSAAGFTLANLLRLNGRRGVFDVLDYGAVADGTTNDTPAINTCLQTAVAAGIADGSYYAEIYFPPIGTYQLTSATIKGGTALGSGLGVAYGNAQIPIPVLPSTARKFVLALQGGRADAGFAHWLQTVGQRAGAVLRSSLTGLTSDGTWGPPSIIGGPTVYSDSGGFPFSNMQLRIDGLTVVAPYNPGIIGVDARCIAQLQIGVLEIHADAGPAGSPALNVRPTNDLGIGLRVPRNNNNDCCVIESLGVEGFYYGVTLGEHFTVTRLALIYCQVALFLSGVGGATYHGASIVNLSVEACDTAFQCFDSDGGVFPIWVGMWSTEAVGTYDLDDQNGNIIGTVNWANATTAATPVVRAGGMLKFISHQAGAQAGAKTAPAVPATTVALLNPFWRDSAVTIAGGTVTVIAVDGQALGVTSGTVIVPSGKTIILTYSSAPTWKWTAV